MEMVSQEEVFRRSTTRRSHVALEWDDVRKIVVAPRTQVGLTWNQACSDTRNITQIRSSTGLVDGFDVPDKLFELSDLRSVLTIEAWNSCLSESERELLSIYLPEGVDQERALRALLNGENLHFGNALHTWGVAVCSGAMHPDNLLQRESHLRKRRKSYFKHVRRYHGKMIQNLQTMKDIWRDCERLEDVLPRIKRWSTTSQEISTAPLRNGCQPTWLKGANKNINARITNGHWGEIMDNHQDHKNDEIQDTGTRRRSKKLKTVLSINGVEENEVVQSDSESKWFKKYVEVAVGTLSPNEISAITKSVKVTRKQFEELKLRRQAGEEVHFDSLEPSVECLTKIKGPVKIDRNVSVDVEKVKDFWQNVILKDLAGRHAFFLERKNRHLMLAKTLASRCMEELISAWQDDENFAKSSHQPNSEQGSQMEAVQANDVDVDVSTDVDREERPLVQSWLGKHLLAGAISMKVETEGNAQLMPEVHEVDSESEQEEVDSASLREVQDLESESEQEHAGSGHMEEGSDIDSESEAEDLDSAPMKEALDGSESDQEDEQSLCMQEGQNPELPFRCDPSRAGTCSPIIKPGNETVDQEECIVEDVQAEGTLKHDPYTILQQSPNVGEEQHEYTGGSLSLGSKRAGDDIGLIAGHQTSSVEGAKDFFQQGFSVPEKQELQLLPHGKHAEIPIRQQIGAAPQHVQEPSQLFSQHTMAHQFENPIASLIEYSKRQQQLNVQPTPLPQLTYPSYNLGSTGSLPLAVPVVEVATMWQGNLQRPPVGGLPQYGQNVGWPPSESAGGWESSETQHNTSSRSHFQTVQAAATLAPRSYVSNAEVYNAEQVSRKPERMFDHQQFYTDWSRTTELPVNDSISSYRTPVWYPPSTYENAANQIQNPSLPRLPLWSTDSVPPKPVPQLWSNMNWRPT